MANEKSVVGEFTLHPTDQKINALAQRMLEIAHEQGLTIEDVEAAARRCRNFVLSRVVPVDRENEVSQYWG